MIRKLRNSRRRKLIAIVASAVLLLSLALSIHIFAADDTEYIYFDLAAGNVTVTGDTYTGYVYVNKNGTPEIAELTGEHVKDNNYYVYQSSSMNRTTSGYYEGSLDGDFKLPEYDRVVTNDEKKTKWYEYITDHPKKWGANSDMADSKNGSNSVIGVIDAWESAVQGKREICNNHIDIEGNVENVNLVIDDVWSKYLNENKDSSREGSISFDASNSTIKGNTINLYIEGDNRLAAIFYATGGADPTITEESRPNKGNTFNFSVLHDKTATLTVAADAHNLTGSFWSAAIGSSDGKSPCEGLVFNDGYIYAGTTEYEDATAIGGGGNGYAHITINGGTITAVASTSGSAIGGGIGKSSYGGEADITIAGGTVYAYNWSFGTKANASEASNLKAPDGYSRDSNGHTNGRNLSTYEYIPSSAIGGGSSCSSSGCEFSIVNISGGYVYAQSVAGTAIGGGSSTNNDGGSTDVTITGGTVVAKSISGYLYSKGTLTKVDAGVAIGGGTGNKINKKGGSATLKVSGEAKLYTGSIGGGQGSVIGSAKVTISGGTIQGQVVMEGKGSTFDMTGGTIDNSNAAKDEYDFVELNGGAVCVKTGTAKISGGTIKNCNNTGNNGGAIYLTNGEVIVSGGTITDCKAASGGAIYVGGGSATVSGGVITKCTAENGGAAYVTGGTFTMTNGEITNVSASENGGAIYVSGNESVKGDVTISGGSLTNNEAAKNGGAVYVNNGDVLMQGGTISENKALDGEGGAFYVSSTNSAVNVTVTSGTISGNDSTGNGGAIAVRGADNSTINVTIGIHQEHQEENSECDHNGDNQGDLFCPEVKNNTSGKEGGAIYISGGNSTNLNIYCIVESGNRGGGNDAGSKDTTLSDFLKVEGGNVIISAAEDNNPEAINNNHGNVEIHSSVYITGGDMSLYGTMENPLFHDRITVDIKNNMGSYNDHRKNLGVVKYYKVEYFENFQDSGQYTAIQIASNETHTVLGVIYQHSGLTIDGWNTEKNGNGIEYKVSSELKFNNPQNLPEGMLNDKLVLYAIWTEQAYLIAFDPNVPTGVTVQGKMETVTLSFTEPYTLPKNLYVYAGQLFIGWKYQKEDGTYATLSDEATIKEPLIKKHGETVTLYAEWDPCKHSDQSKYTLTRDKDDTLRCTCICQYYITATIVGENTVYDEKTHPASITYYESNPESFTKGMIPQNLLSPIVYSRDDGEFSAEHPINAGTYKAKLGEGALEIFTVYVIKKAPQAAPANKPTFKVTAIDNQEHKKLTINEAPEEDRVGKAGTEISYAISYYEDKTLKTVILNGREYDQFQTAWTTYYVYAYYPGNENYEESHHTRSDQAYIYEGKINIYINNPEGVISLITERTDGNAGIMIKSVVEDGQPYYIATTTGTDGYHYIFDSSDSLSGKVNLARVPNEFAFVMDAFNDNSLSGEITFTITGSEHIATVEGSISDGEKFGSLPEGDSVTIANDSAFTTGFVIEYYKNYSDLSVSFDTDLPIGTTVILVDKSDLTPTFWYLKVSESKNSFALAEFIKMGGDGKYTVPETKTTLSYQIIVDFSTVAEASLIAADKFIVSSLTATNLNGAPKLPEKLLTATLRAVNVSIEPVDDEESIKVSFPKSEGAASKWNDLNGAIVLQLKQGTLPIDISLSVDETVNGVIYNTVYDLNEKDQFIIRLNKNATDVSFKLISKMLAADATYTFDISMYASYVDAAPHGGILLGTISEKEFSVFVPKKASAILEGTQKLLSIGDTLKLKLKFNVDQNHTYDILLLRKGDTDQAQSGLFGAYIDTAYEYEDADTGKGISDLKGEGVENEINILLNEAYKKGSFCVVFEVRDKQNAEVLYVPYYFVVQDKQQ